MTAVGEAAMQESPDHEFRRGLRDIAALSALPAIWLNFTPKQIVDSLAESLLMVLGADCVCVVAQSGHDQAMLRTVRGAPGVGSDIQAVCAELARTEGAPAEAPPLPDGAAALSTICVPMGLGSQSKIVVAFGRSDFSLEAQRLLVAVGANLATVAIQRSVAERALREERQALERLNAIGSILAADLDLERIVQAVTDAGTELTGAEFGAFFYNVEDRSGESYTLYTLSGVPRETFSSFPLPRNTAIFEPTFRGAGIVRSDDIRTDPRYGQNPPHHGMPRGHLPVASYLAVPVASRSGKILGGLFFGHGEPGVFTATAEKTIAGLASQAAIAIDNAQLYEAAQRELRERRRIEEHQKLLLDELNHRVKNTLATVQSIATQTSLRTESPREFAAAFEGRILALSRAHDQLSRRSWEDAELTELLLDGLSPFRERVRLHGAPVSLSPREALTLCMAFHELATNAAKYGALSGPDGGVEVSWNVAADRPASLLSVRWSEAGGPLVERPARRGFGSILLERSIAAELSGMAQLNFDPAGLQCEIQFPLGRVQA